MKTYILVGVFTISSAAATGQEELITYDQVPSCSDLAHNADDDEIRDYLDQFEDEFGEVFCHLELDDACGDYSWMVVSYGSLVRMEFSDSCSFYPYVNDTGPLYENWG